MYRLDLPRLAAIFLLATAFLSRVGVVDASDAWIQSEMDRLIQLYQHLHATPELSFHEEKTAERFATELAHVGATVTKRLGGFGVVGILENGRGPTLMLRADFDALPVKELTGLPYASKVEVENSDGSKVGVMHACAHDLHMTNLIGVARFLAQHKDRWSGRVMFIGQPAEERGAGAIAMLDDGLLRRFPRPDFAMALHVNATMATGKVGYRAGYALANVDSVDITLKGRGGHGAYPHTTIDPIVQGAQLVMALQTIVSREVKPIEPAVITVGSIHGGTKHNIIGSSCHLQITVRSYSETVRQQLHEAIKRKAKGVAVGAGAPKPLVTISEGTPSLFNDEDLASRIVPIFKAALGPENVEQTEPSMGGEDFSQYGRAGIPILMFGLGTVKQSRLDAYRNQGQQPPSLHSPYYYPDAEESLTTGIKAMSAAALELLKKP